MPAANAVERLQMGAGKHLDAAFALNNLHKQRGDPGHRQRTQSPIAIVIARRL